MRFFHLSDLHIGKRVHEFSMLEEQADIFAKILKIADLEKPDAFIIAGDIYDRTTPSPEAVEVFDDFLCELHSRQIKVFIISGNHDSAERIGFASRILKSRDIYLSRIYDGKVAPITVSDEFGEIDIYLLPFIKPANVRRFFTDEKIETYTDGVAAVIAHMNVDSSRRNVIVTHQYITGAKRCESEDAPVGGLDNVDASIFSAFDYVALGHIHSPQNVTRNTLRYCGSPLVYSFSEIGQTKSITAVDLKQKGNVSVREIPLLPSRNFLHLSGEYYDLVSKDYITANSLSPRDYYYITLKDEHDIPEVLGKLRTVYPNIMRLDYDNLRTRGSGELPEDCGIDTKSPIEIFSEFYAAQNNQPMTRRQTEIITGLAKEIWEESE